MVRFVRGEACIYQEEAVPISGGTRSGSAEAAIVALCFTVSLIEGFDLQAIGVAAPMMAPALGLSHYQAGLVFTAGVVGLVAGAGIGGVAADRFGRKRVLLTLVALFSLCTIFTQIIASLDGLIAVRFLAGLGLGGGMPCLIAIGTDIAAPTHRARIVTRMFCGSPLGGALVSVAAWFVLRPWGWKALFLIGGIPPLLLLPALALVLPETGSNYLPRASSPPVEPLHQLLWGDRRGAVTLLIWVIFAADLLTLYLLLNWLPSLVTSRGLSAETGSLAAFCFNLGAFSGVLGLGILVDRFGPVWPIPGAYLGLLLAMGGLAASATPLPIMICSTVAGFAVVGALCTLYGVVPAYYPWSGRASAVGAAVAVGRVGSIAGPFLAGTLLQLGLGASSVAYSMVPVAFAALVCAVALPIKAREGLLF